MSVKIVRPKGKGGVVDEAIKIFTPEDLDNVRNDITGKYKLMNDINLLGIEWLPIIGENNSPFNGELDGNGFEITNLTINNTSSDNQGLFGASNQAYFKNITLSNTYINGRDYVGGIVGYCEESYFTNCAIDGEVIGNEWIGGIIGKITNGEILNCLSKGQVTGNGKFIGGIIGHNSFCSLNDCNNEANVIGSINVGGIVGFSYAGEIKKSKNIGEIFGDNSGDSTGGIVGYAQVTELKTCTNFGNVTGNFSVGGIAGQVEMVEVFEYCFSKGLIIGKDSVGGICGFPSNSLINNCSSNAKIKTIGFPNFSHGGLIGYCYLTDVKFCTSNSIVNGDIDVGGFVGVQDSSKIEYCSVNGEVFATGDNVGGFVGKLYGDGVTDSQLLNSYADVNVIGGGNNGGLIGESDGIVQDCYALGNIKINGGWGGGLIGLTKKPISKCYSVGKVIDGSGSYGIGGLIGSGTCTDCYYDTEYSGRIDNEGKGIPKTSTQMKNVATFTGWDFINTWILENDNYPKLR